MWQCCGFNEGNDEYENCLGAPFEQHFSAPAPADLVPYFTVLVSDSDTSTLPSTVAHPSSTPTPTTTPPNPNLRSSPTRLSTAASVGIGIGTTIAVTMAICAGIFMVYSCRKKRHRYILKSDLKNQLHANTLEEDQSRPAPIELDPENYVCEMAPGRDPPQEMMAEFSAQELPAYITTFSFHDKGSISENPAAYFCDERI
ncbi:MAG: hypothetical protein M1822_006261 [Bathelium mastoideum]|nr:MAG: hypothetical protein M1822_006261 [Bathelium mastoideum]